MPDRFAHKRLLATSILLAMLPTVSQAEKSTVPDNFYRLQSEVTLPGKSPDWDYLAFDAAHHRLFIGRRAAGLLAFDTHAQRLERVVTDTTDAGAALLVPSLNRGFTTNEDGTTTVFNLNTLQLIGRVKFADDGDAASYDALTGRIAFISAESRQITFMDARTLKVVGRLSFSSKKLDASVSDDQGTFLVNERDLNMLAKVDAGTMKLVAEFPIAGCSQPAGLAIDVADRRAFVGCRGVSPVLAVLDTSDGRVVTTLPLGRGNDGVVWDAARKRILTTNGVDANIVVYRQESLENYRLEQVTTTRPNARTLAFDPREQKIYTVTAQGVMNPAEPINTGPSQFYPNAYYDGTFSLLTYGSSPRR